MSMHRVRDYKTEAIPLKRMDFSEADRIVTVMTPGRGKLRLLAKGVRRSTSRMAGHLEVFSHAQLRVVGARDLDLVVEAATIESFRDLREDLVRSSHAYHLAELVDAFVQDRDEHRAVFHLLRNALAALSEGAAPPDLIARHFEVHFLRAVGLGQRLVNCVVCDDEIVAGSNSYSVILGGVLCPSCGRGEPSASPIAVDTLKLLRFVQRTEMVDRLMVRVPDETVSDAQHLLHKQIEAVLERRLHAATFVRRVEETVARYSA
ncbi:MAG: repair protein RecO [Chloroflexi bacterium]|nr:repair protein RecO [Chloroflexota bacterium]